MAEHRYAWRGNDRDGHPLQGELHAPDIAAVTAHLQAKRIRPTQIQRQYVPPAWVRQPVRLGTRIPPNCLPLFTRQLATLLQAGIPLLQALEILHRGEAHAGFKALLADVHLKIETGLSLNQALRQHAVFNVLYCNLVAVGEVTGMLDTLLQRLAHHLDKTEALRATVRSALLYPCIVLGLAITVLVVILVFVVPAFENIFMSFGAELPWLTRAVIRASRWALHDGGIVCLAAAGASWVFRRSCQRNPRWQQQVHRLCLRIPVAGPIIRQACTARWARTLATLFGAGIPLAEALESVQGVTGNWWFDSATQSLQAQLMRGSSLSQALGSTSDVFPTMLIQMCAIGEESGALDSLLSKTAEHFETEVDRAVARLSTLLEPFIMVVLGLMIGGLVMALYLPIFQLGQVV